MNVQWYPGHMTKAKRNMQEDVKLVDLIIELVDARVPFSSRNPDIDKLGQGKARLILMNKTDLADPALSARWKAWFEEKGCFVVQLDARASANMKQVHHVIEEACKEKRERDRRRGILNRPVRAMVVGIPNVGKSTFINTFAGRAAAKTGNKPGVTKGNQWIRLNKSLELLDTPGILWPRFENQEVGLRLAFIGSINDEILNKEELAMELLKFMMQKYPEVLKERYDISTEEELLADWSASDVALAAEGAERMKKVEKDMVAYAALAQIAKSRACLLKGNEYDYKKAANLFLDDYRDGRLGRITLEFPPTEG